MKLDTRKPYGTITGHPRARYEQAGVLFNNEGEPIGGDVQEIDLAEDEETILPEKEPINNNQRDFSYASAEAFLKNILAEGPLTRSVVFRECSANNQEWEKVKEAFAALGEPFTRKNIIHWKLKAE